ncbi:MAG: alkaline phosphatase, partial [Planctomycetota bacterium]
MTKPGGVDRRAFLGAAAGTLVLPSAAAAQPLTRSRRAKNLIFLCVDGMSVGALAIGDHVRRARDGRGSAWLEWSRQPHARGALVATAPASGVVTDSAAAA